MDYPQHDHYALLYARYLSPGRTEQLVQALGPLQGKQVLDLCGGGGRAARQALQLGAQAVTVVDESAPMSAHLAAVPGLTLVLRDVATYLHSFAPTRQFDGVVCQQAVTYWFDAELVPLLRDCMKPGAKFVFNTFWDAPPPFPQPRSYEFDGRRYLELSWRSDEHTVEHVQVCEGHAPHTTRFKWVSAEAFACALAPHFDVQATRDGKTVIYCCTAR